MDGASDAALDLDTSDSRDRQPSDPSGLMLSLIDAGVEFVGLKPVIIIATPREMWGRPDFPDLFDFTLLELSPDFLGSGRGLGL